MSHNDHVPAPLREMHAYLESLESRASVPKLKELLDGLDLTREDVSDFVVFDEGRYRRNLVAEGRWYEILVICWRSGQRSPIHNHRGSTCGLCVLDGVCTETIFAHSPCGQVFAIESHEARHGTVAAVEDQDTHQVSNLQSEGQDLVTLHIYSPPLRKMDMFSITDGRIGVFEPGVFEFAHGSGI